ncbi:prepilin-type N-terminal cleavage/methylation domain-containing protein [Thermosulfurimonas marina]|uniref:Prepilin-type N-terminal cleavage/methylation domain-containing protein n=1 Tax=Thermosulfurimonas marina TaxID=2047767 RepID=A0A6H1WR57_9BACT|nr:prepilin-type N-terminal cleavage/methylation domain-containing protein [Thermosulfurimonas marina]QJA05626.1 prepilin-type N-terminal cleavage/methylation domain-containing protein [Thermosulfurimonas marina]
MKGFTLVEMIISLLLFLVVSLGLLYAFSTYNRLQVKNLLRHTATELALKKASQAHLGNCTAEEVDYYPRGFSQPLKFHLDCQRTLLYASKKDRTYRVEITVTWQYRTKNYTYTLATLTVENL